MKAFDMSLVASLAVFLGCNVAVAEIDVAKSVLTQRNDHWRRGAYLAETQLTPSNVNRTSFGRLYTLTVRGPVLAQPLFAKGVNVKGRQRDVLYVATRMNNIHAFDVSSDFQFGSRSLWRRELPEVPPAPANQPVAAVWADENHLDLFVTGSDGRVLSNFWERNRGWWHEWFAIGPDTALGAAGIPQPITAIWGDPNNPRHLNLFMVDQDGTVRTIFCTLKPERPCWRNERWISIGQPGIASRGQPVTAVWRDPTSFKHLDLFIVDKAGRVLSNFWEPGSGWHDWFAIQPGTATATPGRPQEVTAIWGDPSHPQHLNLFIVDKEGSVKTIFCTIQAGSQCWQRERWSSIGPSLAPPGQPVTAIWRDSAFTHLDLFIMGRNGRVSSNFWEKDTGWHTWFSIRPDGLKGASGKPQKVTAVWGDPSEQQHLNLFTVDHNGHVRSIFCAVRPGRQCWQQENWFAISPSSATLSPGQPVAAVWRDRAFSHLDLFATGRQLSGRRLDPRTRKVTTLPGQGTVSRPGTIVSNFWEVEGGWGAWFPVPLRAEALPGMDDGGAPCQQTHGQVGIVGTPVIDPRSEIMYVVYRTGLPLDIEVHHNFENSAQYRFDSRHWLAAIDIATGSDKQQPVEIVAEGFNPAMQLNRPGLLLHNGAVIVAFGAAVCDDGGNPYRPGDPHGWVFAYDMHDLRRLAVFTTASDGRAGGRIAHADTLAGIWQSGTGLSSDATGHIYAFTGNNMRVAPGREPDFSESILRLRLAANEFQVDHYRVPEANVLDRQGNDGDLGAGAPIFPFDDVLVGGGKQGVLYSIKTPGTRRWPLQPHDVPSFQAFFNTRASGLDAGVAVPHPNACDPTIQPAYAAQHAGPNLHGSPVAWQPDDLPFAYIYGMPEKDYVRAFRVHKDSFDVESCPALTTQRKTTPPPPDEVRSPDFMPGGFLSLSANGGRDGVLWASVAVTPSNATNTFGNANGRLIAMDALTLTKLWEDDPTSAPVPFAKFVPPTIASGHVFRVAYRNAVHVYGLKKIRLTP